MRRFARYVPPTPATAAAPAPARLVEAAGATIDPDEEVYRPLTGDQARDLKPLDQARMQQLAYLVWEQNRLANRLIELPLAYLLAEGVRLACDDEEAKGWLDAFWGDPINKLDRRLKEYVRSWKIFGELCLPVYANPMNGHVRLGYVDPSTIESTVQDPDNPALVIGVIVKARDGGKRKLYRTVLDGDDAELLGRGAQAKRAGMVDGECFYWRKNALPNSRRGRSDLLSAIDFCDVYDQLLFGEVERAAALRQVIYDVELTGATAEEVKAKARTIQTPKPLSVRVRNESEKWNVLTPDMKAGDASETARLIRGHVLGGQTIPEHWYGVGGDVNRAVGAEMAEPVLKVLTDEQNEVQAILVDLGSYQVRKRLEALGRAMVDLAGDPAFRVRAEMPELAAKDVSKFSAALAQIVNGAAAAVERGLMTEETAVRLVAGVCGMLGVDIDPAQELQDARQQREDAQGEDAFSLPGGLGGEPNETPEN